MLVRPTCARLRGPDAGVLGLLALGGGCAPSHEAWPDAAAILEWWPEALDFGEVQAGAVLDLPLEVLNRGDAPSGGCVLTAPAPFALSTTEVEVLPGDSLELWVRCAPIEPGTWEELLGAQCEQGTPPTLALRCVGPG